jgi:hypothetical protein
LDIQHERALEKSEKNLKCRLFSNFHIEEKTWNAGFFQFSYWGTLQKYLPQGSDPEEEARFILASNLNKEKSAQDKNLNKRVTPRFEFNFVNMLKTRKMKNECIFYRVHHGTFQRSVNMKMMWYEKDIAWINAYMLRPSLGRVMTTPREKKGGKRVTRTA